MRIFTMMLLLLLAAIPSLADGNSTEAAHSAVRKRFDSPKHDERFEKIADTWSGGFQQSKQSIEVANTAQKIFTETAEAAQEDISSEDINMETAAARETLKSDEFKQEIENAKKAGQENTLKQDGATLKNSPFYQYQKTRSGNYDTMSRSTN